MGCTQHQLAVSLAFLIELALAEPDLRASSMDENRGMDTFALQ